MISTRALILHYDWHVERTSPQAPQPGPITDHPGLRLSSSRASNCKEMLPQIAPLAGSATNTFSGLVLVGLKIEVKRGGEEGEAGLFEVEVESGGRSHDRASGQQRPCHTREREHSKMSSIAAKSVLVDAPGTMEYWDIVSANPN